MKISLAYDVAKPVTIRLSGHLPPDENERETAMVRDAFALADILEENLPSGTLGRLIQYLTRREWPET